MSQATAGENSRARNGGKLGAKINSLFSTGDNPMLNTARSTFPDPEGVESQQFHIKCKKNEKSFNPANLVVSQGVTIRLGSGQVLSHRAESQQADDNSSIASNSVDKAEATITEVDTRVQSNLSPFQV